MFLAVDIGNSQTSFGIFQDDHLIKHWCLETQPSRTSDEIASFFIPLIKQAQLPLSDWEGVALCSVVPPLDRAFKKFCAEYLDQKPFEVRPNLRLGFKLNVDEPHAVGADRIANAAYAKHKLKLPAIIVDFGTAITFDVLSRSGAYEGGVILPGIRLCFDALNLRTSQLPSVDIRFPESVIGKTTVGCIQAGILHGQCDLVDGLLTRTQSEVGEACEVVLTGGYASLFQGKLKTITRIEPNLTLEGIRLLWRQCS